MVNLYTVKQVAFILKVHTLTVRRYIREKKLRALKIAGGVRITEEDLQKFQKEYIAKRMKPLTATTAIKMFSFEDPLWHLVGRGGSLTLPADPSR